MKDRAGVPNYIKEKKESERLARKIEAYWHKLGAYKVRAWVEKQELGNEDFYIIRSNIVVERFKHVS